MSKKQLQKEWQLDQRVESPPMKYLLHMSIDKRDMRALIAHCIKSKSSVECLVSLAIGSYCDKLREAE